MSEPTQAPNGRPAENRGRYVRSDGEAEDLLKRDRRIVVAMRSGGPVGRRAAEIAVELCRRGYLVRWDLCIVAAEYRALRDWHAAHHADALIRGGAVEPEPDREPLAAAWDEIVRHLGPAWAPGDAGRRLRRHWGMLNLCMREKLERGECVDVSGCERVTVPRAGECYVIPPDVYQDGVDYCDADAERWIFSIGRETATGRILASTSAALYGNDAFTCLWLR